jgi:DNA repair photolyase
VRILRGEKKHAVSKGHIGCLGDVATINVARGCGAECVFCYARCVSGAPSAGSLLLYENLPELLRRSLDRRRRPLPRFVLFSTASDPFLGGKEVSDISHACLQILVEHNIGVSLSTRGIIPEAVVELLGRHGNFVRVTVPLPSLSKEYVRDWEPGTAPPRERLFLIQRLQRADVAVEVRIEPLVPFVNDSTEQIRELTSALAGLGLQTATVSYLHLRPGVAEQLQEEAPGEMGPLVLGGFVADDPAFQLPMGKFQHLPVKLRTGGLKRIQRIARERGLRISACHCQNPGIPARRCAIQPPQLPQPKGEQIPLLGVE